MACVVDQSCLDRGDIAFIDRFDSQFQAEQPPRSHNGFCKERQDFSAIVSGSGEDEGKISDDCGEANWFSSKQSSASRNVMFQLRKFTVPQKFFSHFYVVGVSWTTLLLAATWSYAHKMAPLSSEKFHFSDLASHLTGGSHVFSFHKSHLTSSEHRFEVSQAVFLLLLMEIQVLRRLIESVYVFKYSPSARMHIFAYLTGLFFYMATPLSLCANIAPEVARFAWNQVAEFIAKGKSHTSAPEFELWLSINPLTRLGWRQWIGAAVFFWGWIHQYRCHRILGSLREHPNQANEYVIPRGDWFEIVSCPHYLAEIVLYAGIVIASGGTNITVWLLFGFVVANLWLAAGETHQWYLRKFENYPRSRGAIFPYISYLKV